MPKSFREHLDHLITRVIDRLTRKKSLDSVLYISVTAFIGQLAAFANTEAITEFCDRIKEKYEPDSLQFIFATVVDVIWGKGSLTVLLILGITVIIFLIARFIDKSKFNLSPRKARKILRKHSNRRYQEFTSNGGRFQYLKINEAILAGIRGAKSTFSNLIEDNVQLNGAQQNLINAIPSLWKKDFPHVMVIGPGGMGKTVSLLRIWKTMLKEKDYPVPVFIQLNEFNNRPEKNFIQNYINTHYCDIELDKLLKYRALTKNSKDIPSVILLLDGFNEVTAQSNELLLEINQLRIKDNYPGLQIILTSRVDSRNVYQWQDFILLKLLPLNNLQVKNYLNASIPDDDRLLDVLRNPMMLSIYSAQSELPEKYKAKIYLKEKVSSPGEILYNVEAIQRIKIEEANGSNVIGIAYRRFILEHLLPFIGWSMHQSGVFFIQKKSNVKSMPNLHNLLASGIKEILTDDFFDTFDFFNQYLVEDQFEDKPRRLFSQIIDGEIVSNLTLMSKEGEDYRFLHQNFRDYFAARHVQNQIKIALTNRQLPEVVKRAPLDFYVRQMFGELELEHTNLMKYDHEARKWKWGNGTFSLNNNLTKILNQCRDVYGEKILGYTIWNILTIWKELRGELIGSNLSNINLYNFSLNNIEISKKHISAIFNSALVNRENIFPLGHTGSVGSVVLSRDEKHLISCSIDGTVKIWDVKSGRCIRTLNSLTSGLFSVELSPDGKLVAAASRDNIVLIWELESGKNIQTLEGHSQWVPNTYIFAEGNRVSQEPGFKAVDTVSFSPDSKLLATGARDNTVKIWDVNSGVCIKTLQGHLGSVSKISFNPEGTKITSGSYDNTIKIWDVESGECIQTILAHKRRVNDIAFDPTGTKIVSCSLDGTVKIWDSKTGQCLHIIEDISVQYESVSYSLDGKCILTGSRDNKLRLWDSKEFKLLSVFTGHTNWVTSMSSNQDCSKIISSSFDGTCKIWDSLTGESILTTPGNLSGINSSCYSPNGKALAIGASDGSLNLWDIGMQTFFRTLKGHSEPVQSVSFFPAGRKIASGSKDTTIRIWDIENGRTTSILKGHSDSVESVKLIFDGKYLLSASRDNTAKLWDAMTGECLLSLEEHTNCISSVGFSTDGNLIITGSWDKTVKVWDVQNGQCLLTISEFPYFVESVLFNKDNSIIITGSRDNLINLWDAKTGKHIATLEGHNHWITSLAISPNGKLLASSSFDSIVKIWDIENKECIRTLSGPSHWVNEVNFSPDNNSVVLSNEDNSVTLAKIHDVEETKTLKVIPGLLVQGGNFRNLHPNSDLSEDDIKVLRQYGAVFNDEDQKRWDHLMKMHF